MKKKSILENILNEKAQIPLLGILIYSIGILVAIVIISILAINGVFTPEQNFQGKCFVKAPFGCSEFGVNKDGVRIKLINGAGSAVDINKINISGCGENTDGWKNISDGEIVDIFVSCSAGKRGEKFDGNIEITYTLSGDDVEKIVSGEIESKITNIAGGGGGEGSSGVGDDLNSTISPSGTCGNNIIESGEECDDGNTLNGDGCSSTCDIGTVESFCSDGIDNDHDGHIDLVDSGCSNIGDSTEYSGGDYCYEQDEDMLLDVNIEVFDLGGHEAFNVYYVEELIRNGSLYGNLLYSDFSDGNLDINYRIEPRYGGFDVVYNVFNPTDSEYTLPSFQINGLHYNKQDSLSYYNHINFQARGLRQIPSESNNAWLISRGYPYWGAYSPLIISVDNSYAVGSSMQFDHLNYNYPYDTYLFIKGPSITSINSFEHVYWFGGPNVTAGPFEKANISAGENEEYILSVRFSNPKNYIFTVCPYKKFFHDNYEVEGNIQERDNTPVQMYHLAGGLWISPDNPRGYDPRSQFRLDLNGWKPFVDYVIPDLQSRNIKRTMIWLAHGSTDVLVYYPMFMSFWLPELLNSQAELQRFEQNNIQLGYWWERSNNIPDPFVWNLTSVRLFDKNSPSDVSLFKEELNLAESRYAKEIGLDSFILLSSEDRLNWVKEMKAFKPNMRFICESEGPDFLHNEVGNFYHPNLEADNVSGPDLLSWYLNPSNDEWFYNIWTEYSGQEYANRIENLMSWGYTPLMTGSPDLSSIDYPVALVGCMNGIDDDNDGLVDIYDSGCSSEIDGIEG